jgi:hypothetical protein
MRYCLVLLPLLAVGCADTYDNGYAYRGDAYAYRGDAYGGGYAAPVPGYGNGYAYGGESYSPRYAARDYSPHYNGGYYASRDPGSYGGENCGTPDEPKACPPLPRRPLQYYPGDRW